MTQVSAKWQAMSNDKQIAATDYAIQDLYDQKEMQALSLQNVPINAFHNTHANLAVIKSEVRHSFPTV